MVRNALIRHVSIAVAAAAFWVAAPGAAGAGLVVDEEETVFSIAAPGAERVFLVGDFNAWNPTLDRMVARDGIFQIRLFLLPGRYRYRFVVDGQSLADDDNPHRDVDGNSFFILAETAAGYEILFAEPGRPATMGIETAFDGSVAVHGVSDRASLLADARVWARTGMGGEGIFRAGVDYRVDDGAGRGYLIEGCASWPLGDGWIRGFTRRSDLGFGDPAALFGTVGPWEYPVGLFCRGVGARIVPFPGLAGEVVYASRIDGRREGLVPGAAATTSVEMPAGPFSGRTRRGSDMIGVSLEGGDDPVTIRWLARYDRRIAGEGGEFSISAPAWGRFHETFAATGGWLSLRGLGGIVVEAEYLSGRSTIEAENFLSGETGDERLDRDEGRRFVISLRVERGGFDGSVTMERTTIDGPTDLREQRPEGAADVVGADLRFGPPGRRARLAARLEHFSAENTGEVFWLEGRNPWLDGDRLTIGRLPFLGSRRVCELLAGFGGEPPTAGLPDGHGARVDVARRGDLCSESVTELLAAVWVCLPRGIGLILDGRWVGYELDGFDDSFLDMYAGLILPLGSRGWCTLGAGRDPVVFDRWTWSFERRGRNEFLAGRGLYEMAGAGDRDALLETLAAAEKELASGAVFTFEAGFRF